MTDKAMQIHCFNHLNTVEAEHYVLSKDCLKQAKTLRLPLCLHLWDNNFVLLSKSCSFGYKGFSQNIGNPISLDL